MLATKQTESKTSEANAKRAALARGGHDVLQSNPVWQTLALGPLGVQTKLTVSQPDDPYEREADQIAGDKHRPSTVSIVQCHRLGVQVVFDSLERVIPAGVAL